MIQILDNLVGVIAGYAGLPSDPLKIIVCLVLSYPLAAVLKRLPDSQPQVKNIYVISVGLFFLVGIFNLWSGIRTIFISCAGTWLLSKYMQGPLMPWINFVFIMGHMSINQIYRQRFGNDDVVDITGSQMVLVMKLTAFAWNVHDGRAARRAQGGMGSLAPFQQESAITELPDLLSYIAWAMFFPSMLIGPAFEFAQYKKWLDCSLYDVQVQQNTKAAKKMANGRKIPRSGTAASKRAAEGIFWLVCYALLSPKFTVNYVLSDKFTAHSLLYRLWYVVPLAFTHRSKYYGIWKLSEGACVLAGFGFNGVKNGAIDWTSIENISPYEFETAQNTKALLEAWNKNTNKWLKNYVYLRVTPKGKKPGFRSTMATFATSAIWHGFYPGYYFAFATGALAQTMGKYYRRNFRPFFVTPVQPSAKGDSRATVKQSASFSHKLGYDIVSWIVTQYTWAYIVQPFVVLTLMGSLRFWSRYYFIVHIGMFITFAFFNSGASVPLKRSLKQRIAQTEAITEKESKTAEQITMIPQPSEEMEREVADMKARAMDHIDAKYRDLKSRTKQ
ncbi:MBOAT family protein [Taphrina deformans PYCC 5710]|uniref:MBOAT family protein n=1 Tax=Taphrina deformans (strain PYCC 5710 / ATCC 11124 / CBS 356.35 / IMI 108563 / JCM 9778 / NBRC 8474) TaxID=1097556 RepID=R4X775_TAPDE|nr:MBOAT family protein [Taphrina deformans PYCC 5710]|eukprot:CCG81157.1 MBOAT family protein [Taphrina deformans PYCC 5710]